MPLNHDREPLADKVIDRIEQERVVPTPRWQFVFLNRLFWLLFGISLVFGAVAAGAMMFVLANAGWEFRAVTHDSVFSYLWDVLPFFWVTSIMLLLFFSYEAVKRTKWGYRYPIRMIIGFGGMGILFGGGALFVSGLSQEVEQELGKRIPLYHPMVARQQRAWVQPEQGLLAGEITEATAGYATFTIRTFDGDTWIVNGDDLRERDFEYLTMHRVVRLVGVPVSKDKSTVFRACFTFPWEVNGRRSREQEHRKVLVLPPPDETLVRKLVGERSTECRGVRPYGILNAMRQKP